MEHEDLGPFAGLAIIVVLIYGFYLLFQINGDFAKLSELGRRAAASDRERDQELGGIDRPTRGRQGYADS